MTYPILLVSEDRELEARVRRALPGSVPVELVAAPHYRPAGDVHGWLLLLLDAPAVRPGSPTAAFLAEPQPSLQNDSSSFHPPVLWLGEPPQVTRGCDALPGCHRHAVDFLDRYLAPSKLSFILHQHLAAAYLQRQRAPAPLPAVMADPPPTSADLCRQLNNTLTGILGNAELVLEAGRRLPPPVQQRLLRISALAGQMRELMLTLSAVEGKTPA